MKVLVTYASKHHATQDIAAYIAHRIEIAGFDVDLVAVEDVTSPALYEAVIIGSAVYVGNWMSSAAKILKDFADTLADKKVWLFSSGPTGSGEAEELLKGWIFPENLKETVEQIAPQDIQVFHGKLDPNELGWGERLMVKMVKAPEGDYRDWQAIGIWTDTIIEALIPQTA